MISDPTLVAVWLAFVSWKPGGNHRTVQQAAYTFPRSSTRSAAMYYESRQGLLLRS